MPHSRDRFLIALILKRLKFSPVLAIQGCRQTGKSFFVRDLLKGKLKTSIYLTFDRESEIISAKKDVESFLLKRSDAHPLIIDEAQKVPSIFDAIKYQVDLKRTPGKYILLGSTEFSKLSLIHESLTGRISRVRFYPMTMAERHSLRELQSSEPFFLSPKARTDRVDFLRNIDRGGFPGICFIRDELERNNAFEDWLKLTCERDVHQFPKLKIETDLCRQILKQIALLEEPSFSELNRVLRVSIQKLKRHLLVLETLFVIQELKPHHAGGGKAFYYLPDSGLARYLGASDLRVIETAFLHEWLVKNGLQIDPKKKREIFFYKTPRGSRVSFVEEVQGEVSAVQLFDRIQIDQRDFYALESFRKAAEKIGIQKVQLCSYGPMEFTLNKATHFVYEQLA